jgi:hypothetical protein
MTASLLQPLAVIQLENSIESIDAVQPPAP